MASKRLYLLQTAIFDKLSGANESTWPKWWASWHLQIVELPCFWMVIVISMISWLHIISIATDSLHLLQWSPYTFQYVLRCETAGAAKHRTARAASALGVRTRHSVDRRRIRPKSVGRKPGKLLFVIELTKELSQAYKRSSLLILTILTEK